ncbi:MAG TPA: hypothetical protein VIR04_01740 [Paralcaligenes sp.]
MKSKQIAAVFFTALIASAGVSALAAESPGQLDKSNTGAQGNMGAGMMQGGAMGNGSDANRPDANGKHMGRSMMQGGMMGNDSRGCGMQGGMMGNGMMSGMMGGGNGMMRGGAMDGGMMRGHAMMPQLPAGNEKLQLKMQAEIMQKVGEIVAKYADQVVTNKDGAQ